MGYKLVKFDNGKWGVMRKQFLQSTKFVDLTSSSLYHWAMDSTHFDDCMRSESRAREKYEELMPKPKPKFEVIDNNKWWSFLTKSINKKKDRRVGRRIQYR